MWRIEVGCCSSGFCCCWNEDAHVEKVHIVAVILLLWMCRTPRGKGGAINNATTLRNRSIQGGMLILVDDGTKHDGLYVVVVFLLA